MKSLNGTKMPSNDTKNDKSQGLFHDLKQLGRKVMMSNLEDELNFYRYDVLKPEDLPLINEKLKAWRYLDKRLENANED